MHYKINELSIGIKETGVRKEEDSLGSIMVPANRYWGAQTERSLKHFCIGEDLMPKGIYHAYGYIKKAAALVNYQFGLLEESKSFVIQKVAQEVIDGLLDSEFVLYVWQTGSGTQTNMNVNEVISNRSIQLLGGILGSKDPIHPNDDVNKSQSSNDTFPTASHLAAYRLTHNHTLPSLERLQQSLEEKSSLWQGVLKVARTHLMDATPITVGQEFSGYAAALKDAIEDLKRASQELLYIPIGGTAVGTCLNAPSGFGEKMVKVLQEFTGFDFKCTPNKFASQGTMDRLVRGYSALKCVSVTLYKIANDIRWMASGPRCGLKEILLPHNEPGSSIMPGKINPTQAEAMMMVCLEVMSGDVAVQMGGAEGNFELNVFQPVIISNYLRSARILGDVCEQFRKYMIEGMDLNYAELATKVEHSLMLGTALVPYIGYDKVSLIAQYAYKQNLSLKEAAIHMGVDSELVDKLLDTKKMTGLNY